MSYSKLIARLSFSSLQFLKRSYNFFDAVLSGFWLGVISEKSLDFYDDLHYDRSKKYYNDSYNLSGLAGWEKEMIEKYFTNSGRILLIAAGGGRETYALTRMGFEVDSFECNQAPVEYGNSFLLRNNMTSKINYLPKNTVSETNMKYDSIIMTRNMGV